MKAPVTLLAIAFLLVGCLGQNNAPEQVQEDNRKSRTVVVNEGMSKKEEEKLNERLADLEEEAKDQPAGQTTRQVESAEDDVLAAAQDYYAAAAGGDYSYTYDNLSAVSQGQFTEDEWVTKNTTLGSDAGTYNINSVEMLDDATAEVQLTILASGGSSSERTTLFVLESGGWMHDLTPEEYDLFASASAASSSATASASASASASATPETTQEPSSSADMDCSDFSPQAAQAALASDPSDPHGLDEDGDGKACETGAANDQYEAPDPDPDREGARRWRPRQQSEPASEPAPSGGGKDIDCDEVEGPVPTPPGDPNNLDGDDDGLACE